MGEGGFVNQAYRDMVNWQFYHDVPVRLLFDHLLRTVAWEEHVTTGGIRIPEGGILVQIEKLAKDNDLTVEQVRYALKKLASSNEISIASHGSRGSLIVVTRWEDYALTIPKLIPKLIPKQFPNCEQGQQSEKQDVTNDIEEKFQNNSQIVSQINSKITPSSKEPENREIPPETSKENKEQETHIKEENIKEESSSEIFSNQASSQQMILPWFNDFSMKPPRERIAVKNKKLVGIIDDDKKKWKHDFPYLDIDALLEDAEIYLGKHPKKYTDVFGFLNNMFKRQPYPFPKTLDDVLLIAKERNLKLTREAAEYFFNKYQSIGWRDNNNKPIHDWRCLLENFVATWNQNHYGPQTGNFSQSTYGRPTESKPFDPSKYEN